jgi:Zn-dependent protease
VGEFKASSPAVRGGDFSLRRRELVFLTEPNRTNYDLRWQMFGVHVRVHPMFWLMSAVLGWNASESGMEYLFVWIVCVFVSILIHELGHVFMGKCFGADSHIVLYGFGGLAVGANALANPWKRIAVALAGPFAQLVYFALILLALRALAPFHFDYFMATMGVLFGFAYDKATLLHVPTLLDETILFLFEINLFWALLNLLPIWPLDGGQVTRDFLTWLSPPNGLRLSLGISLLVSGLLAIQAISAHFKHPLIPFLWMVNGLFMAFMFGLLAFASFEQLRQLDQRPWKEDWPDRWRRY